MEHFENTYNLGPTFWPLFFLSAKSPTAITNTKTINTNTDTANPKVFSNLDHLVQ